MPFHLNDGGTIQLARRRGGIGHPWWVMVTTIVVLLSTIPQQIQAASSSFWDRDRVGNFWPMDGATYGRASCGNGPHVVDLMLGISGPIQDNSAMEFWLSNNCPPSAAGWDSTSIPEGYERSCSASTVSSVETYYETWLSDVERLFNDINCTSEEYNELDEFCDLLLESNKNNPQTVACGIAPEDFDSAMVPLAKTIPYKVMFESLKKYNIDATSFSNWYGIWNEVTIKAWNGVTFVELGAYLILWYDNTEGSKDHAYQRAEEFYVASGINGGANIRIPVVYRDNNKLYIDPAVDFNEVFSCPADESSATVADDAYVNPCQEFGVAEQLNALYNDPVGPNEKCSTDDGQSYKCSGVIIRTGDAGRPDRTYQTTGSGLAAWQYNTTGSIVDPPNYTIGDPPNYTIGIGNLTSTVCPPDIVDGEYPAFCPDPTMINVGSASFGYLRRDIAPPLSELQKWADGIDPYTGLETSGHQWGIAWSGGGMILMQEDTNYTNPDVVFPGNSEESTLSSHSVISQRLSLSAALSTTVLFTFVFFEFVVI